MQNNLTILVLLLCLLFTACDDDQFQPKPKGYFRLEYPSKEYQQYDGSCPYQFEYPESAIILPYKDTLRPCWFDIVYPLQKAKVHVSYLPLNGNLATHIEDSRTLVYKHTVKATNIEEFLINNESKSTHAILYKIHGNTASSVQFFVTDSTNHFLRGALYFSSSPNSDSLQPAIDYIQADIERLLSSFRWTSES